MRKEKVVEFLLKAKKATYAGNSPESSSTRPESRDLQYEEESLLYIDTYLGGNKFIGEEALWENGKPFWGMNYCGRVIADGFEGDFLKEALSLVPIEMPFRGPSKYHKNNSTYKCFVNGDFEWFIGYEEIYNGDDKVYECIFHG